MFNHYWVFTVCDFNSPGVLVCLRGEQWHHTVIVRMASTIMDTCFGFPWWYLCGSPIHVQWLCNGLISSIWPKTLVNESQLHMNTLCRILKPILFLNKVKPWYLQYLQQFFSMKNSRRRGIYKILLFYIIWKQPRRRSTFNGNLLIVKKQNVHIYKNVLMNWLHNFINDKIICI